MKKIRQHNDIDISVVIKNTEGEILDPFLCKGIQIRVQTNGNETQIAHYDIFEDGHIVFRFNAKDQTQIGVYDIVISATTTDGRVFTTDVCKAFCIVPCTCCTDNEPGEVEIETLEVEATIEITSWGYMYDKRVEDIEKNYSKKSNTIRHFSLSPIATEKSLSLLLEGEYDDSNQGSHILGPDNIILPYATTTAAGVMSANDKVEVDKISKIISGDIPVSKASTAGVAEVAGFAGDCDNANYAETAEKDLNGNSIVQTYATKEELASKKDSIDVTSLFTIGGTMDVRGMDLLQSHLYVQTKSYLSNVTVTVGSQLYLLEAQRRTSTVDYGLVSVMSVVKFTDGVPECVDVVNADSKDAELLKRIQGTSEDSRASTDPFVRMDFRNIGDLNSKLDTMHNDAEDRGKYMGVFRGTVDGGLYILENIVRNYANDVWEQCIRGCYNINSEKPKELIASNKYRILRRSFYEGKWGAWENLFPTDIPISGESYGKKVILLGDSQIAMCKNGSLTLEGMLKEKLNTEVYNFAFGGSRWAYRTDNVEYNAFSVLNVLRALCKENAYAMEVSAIDYMDVSLKLVDDEYTSTAYKNTLDNLKNFLDATDMGDGSEWVIVIAAGGNDFNGKTPLTDVDDYTLFGAMKNALGILSRTYPAMIIHIVSPTYRMMNDGISSDTYTHWVEPVGQMTRWQYGDKILEYARQEFRLPTFDMYRNGGRNSENISALCPDGTHPTSDAGIKATADMYVKILHSFEGGSGITEEYVNNAIAEAITTTLNTEV
jgi:hypothetical protein